MTPVICPGMSNLMFESMMKLIPAGQGFRWLMIKTDDQPKPEVIVWATLKGEC